MAQEHFHFWVNCSFKQGVKILMYSAITCSLTSDFLFSVDYYKTLSCQHLYDSLFSIDHKSRYKVLFSLQKMHHNSHPPSSYPVSNISEILKLAAHWSVKLMLLDFKPAEMTGLSMHEHKRHVRAILGRFSVHNDIRVNMMFCRFK